MRNYFQFKDGDVIDLNIVRSTYRSTAIKNIPGQKIKWYQKRRPGHQVFSTKYYMALEDGQALGLDTKESWEELTKALMEKK